MITKENSVTSSSVENWKKENSCALITITSRPGPTARRTYEKCAISFKSSVYFELFSTFFEQITRRAHTSWEIQILWAFLNFAVFIFHQYVFLSYSCTNCGKKLGKFSKRTVYNGLNYAYGYPHTDTYKCIFCSIFPQISHPKIDLTKI